MNIFEEIKKLGLNQGEYIVLGSGVLGALGIRDIADIDLLITPHLFELLKEKGWTYHDIKIEDRTRQKLTKDEAEAFTDFWYGGNILDPDITIANAYMIQGIPFLPLGKLLEIKRILNRPKDQVDVALIEKYLSEK